MQRRARETAIQQKRAARLGEELLREDTTIVEPEPQRPGRKVDPPCSHSADKPRKRNPSGTSRFRSARSAHFLSRLQSDISSRFEFQGSDGQRRYEVEVSAAPGCEDYKKFNWKELCKHVIWVYLYVLKVDEESPLINQITLDEDSVRQIVTESLPIASSSVDNISPSNDFRNRMERVKSILSKDKRKDQQLMWYLLHNERKPGENLHCKALRCKKEVLPGNLCVSVKGLEVRTNRHLLSSRISTSVHNWTVCGRLHRGPIWQFLTRFQSREMFLMPKLQVPCEMVFLCHLMIELNKSGLQSQKSGINKGTLRY